MGKKYSLLTNIPKEVLDIKEIREIYKNYNGE